MASQQLLEAANKISQNPVAIQMRYLQTLTEIAVEKNSTIVFPLPIELLRMLDRIGAPKEEKTLDTAPIGVPHELVQLELEAHGQLVCHDALGQPSGVQATPDGAEEDVQAVEDAVRFAPGLGP